MLLKIVNQRTKQLAIVLQIEIANNKYGYRAEISYLLKKVPDEVICSLQVAHIAH